MSQWWIIWADCKQRIGQLKPRDVMLGYFSQLSPPPLPPSPSFPSHPSTGTEIAYLESLNIYTGGDGGAGVFFIWLYRKTGRTGEGTVAPRMIMFTAVLTGGVSGGCKPLIKAVVNDAESSVEMKPLMLLVPWWRDVFSVYGEDGSFSRRRCVCVRVESFYGQQSGITISLTIQDTVYCDMMRYYRHSNIMSCFWNTLIVG